MNADFWLCRSARFSSAHAVDEIPFWLARHDAALSALVGAQRTQERRADTETILRSKIAQRPPTAKNTYSGDGWYPLPARDLRCGGRFTIHPFDHNGSRIALNGSPFDRRVKQPRCNTRAVQQRDRTPDRASDAENGDSWKGGSPPRQTSLSRRPNPGQDSRLAAEDRSIVARNLPAGSRLAGRPASSATSETVRPRTATARVRPLASAEAQSRPTGLPHRPRSPGTSPTTALAGRQGAYRNVESP